jgi:benzoyl-CoA reductase/2-hydroxyglutaryl-CoA dehydratase subunit BcrC/BadD/HgdB
MNVPTYNIDMMVPPADADLKEVTDYYVRYQHEQYKGLVAFLERQTGKPLDRERLWDAIRKGDEAWRLWYEVDRLRRAIPSPMPSQDHFNVMVPAAYLSGTNEAVSFFRELYDEVKSRVASKIGVIPDEKYRLLYGGGPPPWHTMWMFNFFESLGAIFVMENMYRGYDPVEVPAKVKDPVEYIAWRCFLRRTQQYDKARKHTGHPVAERLLEFIEDYKIDGLAFHACRSCRANTVGQMYIKELLRHHTSIPIIQLTSDMIDQRDYSEAQWKAQITAFVEAVAAHKNQRNK